MPNEIGRARRSDTAACRRRLRGVRGLFDVRAAQLREGYATGSGSSFALCLLPFYFTEQGVGFQPAASGSFLKSDVVMYGRVK